MKVSELWLRTLINPKLTFAEILEQLTQGGLEVDSLESVSLISESGSANKDFIADLKVPPNRGDCLSVVGIAREVALFNRSTPLNIPHPKTISANIKDTLPVHIQAATECPYYAGRIIQGVSNTMETPAWMRDRLEKSGIRTISLLVDISNYVMLELGQPLHVFDLKKVKGDIYVRLAKKGDTLTLLNDQKITLEHTVLVIADNAGPQAIAGVMGGNDTAVDEHTQNIFIESAYFDPVSVRLSARKYGLQSDSSYRFERGVELGLQTKAIERFTELLNEIQSSVKNGPITEVCPNPEKLKEKISIFVPNALIKDMLGIELKDAKIQEILSPALQLSFTDLGFNVIVPSYRMDLRIPEDIIEEIACIYGYHNIPAVSPTVPFKYPALSETKIPDKSFKTVLVNRGYSEAITYSFVDPKLLALFEVTEQPLALANPISSEMSVMRTNLLPGLVKAAEQNLRRQQNRVKLFEVGNVYIQQGKNQEKRLAGVCIGNYLNEQWGEKARLVDFYDVKNDIEALIQHHAESQEFKWVSATHPFFHPAETASLVFKGQAIGTMGVLHPRIVKALELPKSSVGFGFKLEPLQQRKLPQYQFLSKFPEMRRDIAVLVSKEILAENIQSAIVESGGSWLQAVKIFDVFQGKSIDPSKKSVALGLIWQHPERTLKEEEVNAMLANVVKTLNQKFNAILRE